MARTKISEFSATAADNTDIDGIDIAEGCAPSGINNAIRTLMADLKNMQTGASGDTFTFASLNATTANIDGGTIDGATIGGSSAAAGTFTSLSDSGNLAFTGTGNRITGDFSNATASNRVAFQSSTVNGATTVEVLPNGTSVNASISLESDSAATNSSRLILSALGGAECRINSAILGTGSYLPMTFYTGGSERVRIDTSGNVGIGTSSPASRLHVVGAASTTAAQLRGNSGANIVVDFAGGGSNYQDASNHIFRSVDGVSERMRIDSSGNLSVGISSATGRLTVRGSTSDGSSWVTYQTNAANTLLFAVLSNGGFYTGTAANSPYNNTTGSAANLYVDSGGLVFRSTSSLKYKTDVRDAEHGLADVLKLRSVTYKAKNDGDTVFGGLIAEEVHEAGLTEFVQYADDGSPDAIHYGNMVALLAKSIQEQQQMINELRNEIAALKGA